MSLFKPAEKEAKRLKMYVFGDSGTGKTVTSLKFPKPVMIDAEKGSDYYGSMFEFERLQTSDPKIVNQALDELLKDPKDYKTLVIDPFSIVYDRILNLQESKMKMKTGNPSYSLQPLDYKHIKGAVKSIIYRILALDMNVIITARSKPLYSNADGDFMKVIGKSDKPSGYMNTFFAAVKDAGIVETHKEWNGSFTECVYKRGMNWNIYLEKRLRRV